MTNSGDLSKGGVLILVMIISVVLMLMGYGLYLVSQQDRINAIRARQQELTLYLAEAGMHRAAAYIIRYSTIPGLYDAHKGTATYEAFGLSTTTWVWNPSGPDGLSVFGGKYCAFVTPDPGNYIAPVSTSVYTSMTTISNFYTIVSTGVYRYGSPDGNAKRISGRLKVSFTNNYSSIPGDPSVYKGEFTEWTEDGRKVGNF